MKAVTARGKMVAHWGIFFSLYLSINHLIHLLPLFLKHPPYYLFFVPICLLFLEESIIKPIEKLSCNESLPENVEDPQGNFWAS